MITVLETCLGNKFGSEYTFTENNAKLIVNHPYTDECVVCGLVLCGAVLVCAVV